MRRRLKFAAVTPMLTESNPPLRKIAAGALTKAPGDGFLEDALELVERFVVHPLDAA